MGRYGTKTAASKATPVQNNGVLDHFVGRNGALVAVFRVRQTGVGQVVTPVEFPLSNRWVGRIYDHYLFLHRWVSRAAFKLFDSCSMCLKLAAYLSLSSRQAS